jgi:cobalt-precorrin 5A hydrolase
LPPNLARYPTFDALKAAAPAGALCITYRVPPDWLRAAVYHPRCLVVGVGCNRGTPAAEIISAVTQTFEDAGLAIKSICKLATIEDKADEAGLLAACEQRGWDLEIFSREQIAAVEAIPNPSEWAHKALGVWGVAEPAALLGAGVDTLLVEKRKFVNVTVAVAKCEVSS